MLKISEAMYQPRLGDSMVERMFVIEVAYSLPLGGGLGRGLFFVFSSGDVGWPPLLRKQGAGGFCLLPFNFCLFLHRVIEFSVSLPLLTTYYWLLTPGIVRAKRGVERVE